MCSFLQTKVPSKTNGGTVGASLDATITDAALVLERFFPIGLGDFGRLAFLDLFILRMSSDMPYFVTGLK